MRKKQEVNKIAHNLTEPETLLNKVINAIKVSQSANFEVGIVSRAAQSEVHSVFGEATG